MSLSNAQKAEAGGDILSFFLERNAIKNRFRGQLKQSEALMDQSYQSFLNGELALLTAQNQSTALLQSFNKVQAYNAVETAKQGRSFSGGSIQAVMRGDMANLQFDTEFAQAIGQYEEKAYKRQSENYYQGALTNISDALRAGKTAAYANLIGTIKSAAKASAGG
jgi:hypothetical protein